MRARSGHLEPRAFRGGDEFAARAMHLNAQFAHVLADARARFHNGLMQFVLYLLRNVGRSRGNDLADVRTQLARRGINDLELFLDADGEAVSHELALRICRVLLGTLSYVSYRDAAQNTPMPRICRTAI